MSYGYLGNVSIIHPRCIKEVFSDATFFIADFGLFLHHIGSDSNPGMTLEEPSRLRDRDVLGSCLYESKEKTNKGRTSTVLIDICPFVHNKWKQGIPHSSAIYNTIFTSSGFGWLLQPRSKSFWRQIDFGLDLSRCWVALWPAVLSRHGSGRVCLGAWGFPSASGCLPPRLLLPSGWLG